MRKRRRRWGCQIRWAGLMVVLASASGCSGRAGTLPGPRPVQLGAEEIEAAAVLLRLEDRREYDSLNFARLAAADHPEVRRRAALAIGRVRDPAGVRLLIPLLADPDTAVAATGAFALSLIRDTSAVAALLPLLSPEAVRRAPTVAGEAASALGKLGTAPARFALDSLLRTTPVATGAAPLVIGPALLAIWQFPRGEERSAITRWTESADPELRWRAAYALVRRPDPAATPTLLGLTGDPDPRVRALALRGLTLPLADSAGIAADTVLPALLSAVRDSSYMVRINAARSLGTFPGPASVQMLQALLRSPEAHLAWTAAESLGRLGARAADAAPALRSVAADASVPVPLRSAALLALAQVAPGEAALLAPRFAGEPEWRLRAAAAQAYAALGSVARPGLVELARDPDARVAATALGAVAPMPADSLLPLRDAFVEALGASDVMVRAAALAGLGTLAEPAMLPLLLDAYERALADTLNDAALAAVDALGALQRKGTPAARAFFRRFARPGDSLLRQRAGTAFGSAAAASWGAPLPIETGITPAEYREIIERWVVPALAGTLPRARIETEAGTLELELFAADAPLTVRNFARLAERGYFDGQRWPRVVPNFVIQGGDPRGDMSGGPGWEIRDELNRHRYGRGTVGMALSGPDTGGSQFFVAHSPQPHLDGGYTAFGQVTGGLPAAERILPGEEITRVTVAP